MREARPERLGLKLNRAAGPRPGQAQTETIRRAVRTLAARDLIETRRSYATREVPRTGVWRDWDEEKDEWGEFEEYAYDATIGFSVRISRLPLTDAEREAEERESEERMARFRAIFERRSS